MMIKLGIKREGRWIEAANGVRLFVEPVSITYMVAARRAYFQALHAAEQAGLTDAQQRDCATVAYAVEMAACAVTTWEGVGDAEGNPVDPTPDLVREAFDQSFAIYAAFDRDYVTPALAWETEKNASSPSPTGTSAGASDIAAPAASDAPNVPSE